MKRVQFSGEQPARILQEADRSPIAEVAKHHGFSKPEIYSWRKKFGDLGIDDAKRLKQLAQASGRLKKILAERNLELEVMSAQDRLEQARHAVGRASPKDALVRY
jgi:putative transposase